MFLKGKESRRRCLLRLPEGHTFLPGIKLHCWTPPGSTTRVGNGTLCRALCFLAGRSCILPGKRIQGCKEGTQSFLVCPHMCPSGRGYSLIVMCWFQIGPQSPCIQLGRERGRTDQAGSTSQPGRAVETLNQLGKMHPEGTVVPRRSQQDTKFLVDTYEVPPFLGGIHVLPDSQAQVLVSPRTGSRCRRGKACSRVHLSCHAHLCKSQAGTGEAVDSPQGSSVPLDIDL